MKTKQEVEHKMVQAIEHLHGELHALRTGRANPAMVSGVKVMVYGTEVRLQDLASIAAAETRQLLVTPYDRGNVSAIDKAIKDANLGFNPIVEGGVLRINIPAMDDAMRKKMIKLAQESREKCKVVIRNERQNGNKIVRKQKADGEIPEDQMKRLEKEIQEITDKYCKQADELCAVKEKEISTL